jgi:pilus assembly protein Flp/PilA
LQVVNNCFEGVQLRVSSIPVNGDRRFDNEEIEMAFRFARHVVEFLKAEEGPTAVEYAVMLALIIVVCLTAITSLGTAANNTFGNVSQSIAASGGS